MRKASLVVFSALMVVIVTASFVLAGGGINYKVTIYNPMPYKVEVTLLYYDSDPFQKEFNTIQHVVSPTSTAVIQTGAECPAGLKGQIYAWTILGSGTFAKKQWLKMKSESFARGTMPREYIDKGDTLPTCWDQSYKICRKKNFKERYSYDYDFGFCKN